jgi:hypothetical protein
MDLNPALKVSRSDSVCWMPAQCQERDDKELQRHRIVTPSFDYEATARAVVEAAEGIERKLGRSAFVGMGIPGNDERCCRFTKPHMTQELQDQS